jgi:hypothetical protein
VFVPRRADYDLVQADAIRRLLSGVLPAVIGRDTRHCLDEYRAFRHVVRNVYAFNLRPSRLQELVSGLRPCFDSAARDLLGFAAFLEPAGRIRRIAALHPLHTSTNRYRHCEPPPGVIASRAAAKQSQRRDKEIASAQKVRLPRNSPSLRAAQRRSNLLPT